MYFNQKLILIFNYFYKENIETKMDEKGSPNFEKYYQNENPLESVSKEFKIVNKYSLLLFGTSIFLIFNRLNKRKLSSQIKNILTKFAYFDSKINGLSRSSKTNSYSNLNNDSGINVNDEKTIELFNKNDLYFNDIKLNSDKEKGGDSTGYCDYFPSENISNILFNF